MQRDRSGSPTTSRTGWRLITIGVSLEVVALFIESITA